MTEIIQVKNLRKTYRTGKAGSFEAVKGVSFAVEKGEIFGILGPNGAGKTTTLEIMEGLRKQTQGEIKVLGLNNLTQGAEIRRRIGVQLQQSEYLPLVTLGELLRLFASLYGQTTDVTAALARVDLLDKEHEPVRNLSGGQKQRFTVATSLVNSPDIIFLDEPTTGLDPAARRQMWKLIQDINQKGVTVILTTHYMEEAEFLCHRVAIMNRGQILKIDAPRRLIGDLAHTTQASFLVASPCDSALFRRLPGVTEVYSNFPKITLELSSLDHIQQIVEALKANQIIFSGFTVKTASLEDVYLDLTGQEYQET